MRKVISVHYEPPVRTLNGWDMRIAGTETKIEQEDCDMVNNKLMSRENQIEEMANIIRCRAEQLPRCPHTTCSICKATELYTAGYRKQEWISVEERLPEDGENVLIWVGKVESARIEKGISEDEREKMKNGELEDPIEYGWSKSDGLKAYKRSQVYRGCDVFGNNLVPYCWKSTSGPMEWFGQKVTHWMPLPMPPKGDEGK